MAVGTDNPRPLSDGATYFIRDPLGRRQLFQVESHDVNREGGVSGVAGPSGMLGKTRAAGGFTIALKVRHASTVRDEVPWDVLCDQDIDIVFEIQYKGGLRRIFRDCTVSVVGDSADNAGNVTFSVTLYATKRDNLNPN